LAITPSLDLSVAGKDRLMQGLAKLGTFLKPSFLPVSISHRSARLVAEYGCAAALSLLILVWVMRLWEADLTIPFRYSDDALLAQMMIRTGIDNPWYWHNHCLGMPGSLEFEDYPAEVSASFLFLFIKLLALALPDSAVVMNVFYLAGFPLVALAALFVLRSLRLSYAPALVMALLYAFLPYHLYRGEPHLFLAAYFTVPFMVLLVLWSWQDAPLFLCWDTARCRLKVSLRCSRPIASLALCIIIGCCQIYYAFFTCFFLLLTGFSSSLYKKRLYPLCRNLGLAATIGLVTATNLAPSLCYQWKHGRNEALKRSPGEAEMFGMKIVQLLLPVEGHRLHFLRRYQHRYNLVAPLVNENNCSALGLVGAAGFLLLVARLFYRRPGPWRPNLMDMLSTLVLGAILLASIGGFGSLIAFTASSQIRAYNRISIFIGFFALLALGLLLDKLRRRYATSGRRQWAFLAFLAGLLTLGVLDQTSSWLIPPYAAVKKQYQADAEFIAAIEESVPAHAMIFQLPYLTFPNPAPTALQGFDHLRGYLHSKALRWSYAAMIDRETDLWQRRVLANPPEVLVKRLAEAGFSGVYINRDGYADRICPLEAVLARMTNAKPIESADRQLAFYSLERLDVSKTETCND